MTANTPIPAGIYQGRSVKIDIRTLAVIDAAMPARALGPALEWAALHELEANWLLAASGERPRKIAPLQ